ncbi:MAG: hypothetical protein FWE04_05220 [Oscillospiraceae bacterium]|nr:hypothetical protein [Oscillospiraceae bacterium]
MFCPNCGVKVAHENAHVCISCGVLLNQEPPQIVYVQAPAPPELPMFYKAGFTLGVLSLCIPMHGLFLGAIGLPFACISKRKSSIIMNSIGIVVWGGLIAWMASPLFPA